LAIKLPCCGGPLDKTVPDGQIAGIFCEITLSRCHSPVLLVKIGIYAHRLAHDRLIDFHSSPGFVFDQLLIGWSLVMFAVLPGWLLETLFLRARQRAFA